MDKFNQTPEELPNIKGQKITTKKNIINFTNKSLKYIFSTFIIVGLIKGLIDVVKTQEEVQKSQKEIKKNKKEEIKESLLLKQIENKFLGFLYNIIIGIKEQNMNSIQLIRYLDTMKDILDKNNIISSKILKKKEIENLNYIKQKYHTDKDINKLVKQIIDKLNSYDVNPLLVKKNYIINQKQKGIFKIKKIYLLQLKTEKN